MNTITCPKCGHEIEINKALEDQIEARVIAGERHRHEGEVAQIRLEQTAALAQERAAADAQAAKKLEADKELLRSQAAADLELERTRLVQEAANAQRRASTEQAGIIQTLRDDAEASRQDNAKLRTDLSEMMKQLREERQARANSDMEAARKLLESETQIRDQATRNADEKYRLKEAEKDKQIADMKRSLDEAQRKAAQGSQQNQGEVLELELENSLRESFPNDQIDEVKKGVRGADVIQTVRNKHLAACGTVLYETKNGKWQPAWVAKFKQDIREANANIGVIVSAQMPPEYGDMKQLDPNLWAVKPALAPVLGAALRATILQVDAANNMNAGKDAKMETLYQFLVGPEFRHRIEAIVENYSNLQSEMEREKRASALRWARQDKSIRAVIDNTIGLYGDFQGITDRALPAIKTLELTDGDDEAEDD